MTRLRVLPLPPVTVGEVTHAPFVLVVDELPDREYVSLTSLSDMFRRFGLAVGAKETLLSVPPIDLDASSLEVDPAVVERIVGSV